MYKIPLNYNDLSDIVRGRSFPKDDIPALVEGEFGNAFAYLQQGMPYETHFAVEFETSDGDMVNFPIDSKLWIEHDTLWLESSSKSLGSKVVSIDVEEVIGKRASWRVFANVLKDAIAGDLWLLFFKMAEDEESKKSGTFIKSNTN